MINSITAIMNKTPLDRKLYYSRNLIDKSWNAKTSGYKGYRLPEQERIPVGCVPTVAVGTLLGCLNGGCLPKHPQTDSPWAYTPWADTPWVDTLSGRHLFSRHLPLLYHTPSMSQPCIPHPLPMWTEWHTAVQTLPSPLDSRSWSYKCC